jgi:hypothetical protein
MGSQRKIRELQTDDKCYAAHRDQPNGRNKIVILTCRLVTGPGAFHAFIHAKTVISLTETCSQHWVMVLADM